MKINLTHLLLTITQWVVPNYTTENKTHNISLHKLRFFQK
jgi:hypothetical protein